MVDLFSDDARRDPYPMYDRLRDASPVFHEPHSGHWMVFDYEGVKRVLSDPDTFSSRYGPEWLIFFDPPQHTRLRALISRAFTPRSVADMEPRIRQLAGGLLDRVVGRGEIDLVADFTAPLPMLVIAEMLGVPAEDRASFHRWGDAILAMSYTISDPRTEAARVAAEHFLAATGEMNDYLTDVLRRRLEAPRDDLLGRLAGAELDGQRLTQPQILGLFQLLLLAGTETTMDLINNALLCFIEHPDQFARLRAAPGLLPTAVEEVLRYRSPLQWMSRLTRRDVEMHGQVIPAGRLVLAVIGAANRDPRQFPQPGRFDVTRDPNPHLAFGHGLHFCLGAALARLEARVALEELLKRATGFRLAGDGPWQPRRGTHVLGPARLPICFEPVR